MHPYEQAAKDLQEHIIDDLDGGYECSVHDYTNYKVTQTEQDLQDRINQLDEMIRYVNYLQEQLCWEKGLIHATIEYGKCRGDK